MLTVILGSVNLAEGKLAEAMPDLDELRSDLLELRSAAERSAMLTGQLLAFAGKQAHNPRNFDLDHLVRGLAQTIAASLSADIELELSTQVYGGAPIVTSYELQFTCEATE